MKLLISVREVASSCESHENLGGSSLLASLELSNIGWF